LKSAIDPDAIMNPGKLVWDATDEASRGVLETAPLRS